MTRPWEIPASWEWLKIGEVATIVGGGTPKTSDSDNFDGGEIPWVTPADLSGYKEKYIARGARNITEKGLKSSSARLLPADAVLFSSRAPIGYVAIASQPVTTNQGFKSFILPGEIASSFVYFYLLRAKETVQSLGGGTTFKEISGAAAATIPLALAPLPEQHRIVAEIETQFTRLDASVAALRRAQANLKRYRASVLKDACEGRLVPTEAELARSEGRDYEPAGVLLERILAERRARWESQEKRRGQYKEPVPPDTSGLPELPEGWDYASIGFLLSSDRPGMKTGPFGSLLKKEEHRNSGVPVLGIENIRRMEFVPGNKIFVTPQKSQELSGYDVQAEDILISRSGTVGEACVVPNGIGEARFSTNLMRLSLVKGYISPAFFCLLFNGSPTVLDQVKVLCSGSTRDFLNGNILRSLAFPIPPLSEQRRIVAEVERRLSVIQQAESTVEASLARAERLRQSILKQAFSGKLVPQDPNDEPASVLLERIKAERVEAQATAASKGKAGRRGKGRATR